MKEPFYDPSERDDSDLTREEFEAAMGTLAFPTITIPDPAAVGKWLDEQLPQPSGAHTAHYSNEWSVCHWHTPGDYIYARGETPEAVLAEIRLQLAQMDPLSKLRKEAEQHGYCLTKLPTD